MIKVAETSLYISFGSKNGFQDLIFCYPVYKKRKKEKLAVVVVKVGIRNCLATS